jgi:hypothetical protein
MTVSQLLVNFVITQRRCRTSKKLKGSLKLNGSVWVKAVQRDALQFVGTCRYHEWRIKN